jgi:hypothetical protein
MIPTAPDQPPAGGPTPEMLAGVYLCIESEEDLTLRPYQQPQPNAAALGITAELPTTDHLAGVYLCVEGPEDLAVYPRSTPTATHG